MLLPSLGLLTPLPPAGADAPSMRLLWFFRRRKDGRCTMSTCSCAAVMSCFHTPFIPHGIPSAAVSGQAGRVPTLLDRLWICTVQPHSHACRSHPLNGTHARHRPDPRASVQAFKSGRLQVHEMECSAPLTYPLASRSGATFNWSLERHTAGDPMHLLVLDLGAYPVQLTARTTASRTDSVCPFNCSGHQDLCHQSRCTCPSTGAPTNAGNDNVSACINSQPDMTRLARCGA
jgi:hypothetical protein